MTFTVTLLFWVFSSSFLWAERNRVQQPKNVIDSLMKIPKHTTTTTTTNGSWYVADGRDISCPFIPTPCVLFFDSFLREQRSLVLPKNSLKYFLTPNSRFQTMSDLSLYPLLYELKRDFKKNNPYHTIVQTLYYRRAANRANIAQAIGFGIRTLRFLHFPILRTTLLTLLVSASLFYSFLRCLCKTGVAGQLCSREPTL
jgi:hypothetical protein